MKSDPRKSREAANAFRQRLAELRAQAALATTQANRTERLVDIVERRKVDTSKPVTAQIDDLLLANYDMSFSSAELIDIVHGSPENVRRALVRLQERGRIERYEDDCGAGWYQINRGDRARRQREEGLDR